MTKQYDWFWYELITSDPQAAADFYHQVVGWTITPYGPADAAMPYLVGSAGDAGVVGFMARPPQMPANRPAFWSGYLYATDVDATVASVRSGGGKIFREPFDIPTVGRAAVIGDPEGAPFNLLQPSRAGADGPPKLGTQSPGHVSWCELHSDHPEKNFAWYTSQFGWQAGEAMDMGQNGTYQLFTTNDLPSTGGSCGKMGANLPTHWLFYFFVDGLDAAVERVKNASGTIFMGPHEVPGGTWIAIGTDPQGAVFALHATRR